MALILPLIQLLYALVAIFCGITILNRNHAYLGNIFLGVGYVVYSIPGFLLAFSHFFNSNVLIINSVRSMVIGSAYGIVFLYYGTKIYFKGIHNYKRSDFYWAFAGATFIHILVLLMPNAVIILTTSPVNSQLDIRIGFLILAWHFYFCFRSMENLLQVRSSAIETDDHTLQLKINFILLGFMLSVVAIMVYSLSNFGESELFDIIFFALCLADLISIYLGLMFKTRTN